MFLKIQMLANVANFNSFGFATEVRMTQGNAKTVYFRLVDSEQNETGTPPGIRYIPASGATISIDFLNIDDSKKFSRAATNPFPEDTSIWAIDLLSTDPLKGTVSLKVNLVEGLVSTSIFAKAVLLVNSGIGANC